MLPLLAGGCYLGLSGGVELGAFHFTALRILIFAGMVRVIIRWERLPGGFLAPDWIMVLWSLWAIVSTRFHDDPRGDLVFKLGAIYNNCGIYFLCRVFITRYSDLITVCRLIIVALIPIAAGMIYEQFTMRNVFAAITNVPEISMTRGGKIRAFGPFAHPILSGTVGAAVLPMIVSQWRHSKIVAWAGGFICLVIVFASGSSGPMMSAISGVTALFFWTVRRNMAALRWGFVGMYLVLNMVMKQPAYYLIARMDVTGNSTGWHRAALIESSLVHLNEWWLAGTDYTRHWMPSGVSWNPNHTDITNHYLQMGVLGGLPLMGLLLASIICGFFYVGRRVRPAQGAAKRDQFVVWGLGSALFGVATTCVSVSFFDQSVLFLYLVLAAIVSTCHRPLPGDNPKRRVRETTVLPGPAEPVSWGAGARA